MDPRASQQLHDVCSHVPMSGPTGNSQSGQGRINHAVASTAPMRHQPSPRLALSQLEAKEAKIPAWCGQCISTSTTREGFTLTPPIRRYLWWGSIAAMTSVRVSLPVPGRGNRATDGSRCMQFFQRYPAKEASPCHGAMPRQAREKSLTPALWAHPLKPTHPSSPAPIVPSPSRRVSGFALSKFCLVTQTIT